MTDLILMGGGACRSTIDVIEAEEVTALWVSLKIPLGQRRNGLPIRNRRCVSRFGGSRRWCAGHDWAN